MNHRSSRSPGLGRPASGTVSMGMPSCCACQMARATLPRFSLPSETSSRRGTRPGGQRGDAVADGVLQVRAAAGGARGMAPGASPSAVALRERRRRAWRARRASPASSGGRARVSTCAGDRRFARQVLRRNAGRRIRKHRDRHFALVHSQVRTAPAPAAISTKVAALSSSAAAAPTGAIPTRPTPAAAAPATSSQG